MRPSPPRATWRTDRGVALVIVLAFVLLLTGLILAFFSRAISERQISNSSAGQVKIDLFTQGAVATIMGDLQQEIAAGSKATYYKNGQDVVASVYQPVVPQTAVPALSLKGQSNVTSFAANLVKRSAYSQNFFPGGSDVGAGNYVTGTTATIPLPVSSPAPTPTPAPSRAPSNRAANLPTTTAAANGRTISLARWNKALLLPKAPANLSTTGDLTPATTAPTNNFAAPDWVLVARDGSNPGSSTVPMLFTGTTAVNQAKPSNSGFVVGRYAYTIYNEGGLLDANAAGYPALTYPPTGKYETAGKPYNTVPTGKGFLAYADLTAPVMPPDATASTVGTPQNLLTPAQVNTLVGWRNYASSQPTSGSFPNYVPSLNANAIGYPSLSFFDVALLQSVNGLIGASSPLYRNQSDRMFGSRQELINFFTQGLPTSPTDTATVTALQNALQYFGTFSRGLNQPSYAPVSRADPTIPRPLIQTSSAVSGVGGGGNNVGDNYTTAAAQDVFSPSLLAVRVAASSPNQWLRYDGTSSVVGEPLVKSRFPLQRLSWISYLGPAVSATGDNNLAKLTSTYGIPTAYVQQGNATNIRNYFGLTWDQPDHLWKYNVHNRGGTSGAIRNLQEIVDQREPDFFELLKASVDPGALGKASIKADSAQPGDPNLSPLNFDFKRDIALDAAIIQLGANIIDQYDLDGYPTRIVYVDSSGLQREFRGVENLPYIYRIRTGALKVRESSPVSERAPSGKDAAIIPLLHSGTQAGYTAKPLTDTGAGIIMSVPDIWNPHDQNSALGSPGPGQSGTVIRLVANSATPDTIYANTGTANTGYSTFTTGGFVKTDAAHGTYRGTSFSAAVTPDVTAMPAIPYFTRGANNPLGTLATPSLIMSGSNGGFNYPHAVSPTTTSYLTFKVSSTSPPVQPNTTLYREPTLLGQADPTGPSALTMVVDPSNLDITNLQGLGGVRAYSSTAPAYGIKSAIGLNPLGVPGGSATSTQGYIGMVLGTYPLRWVGPRWSGSTAGTLWNYSDDSLADTGLPVSSITYSLQYLDPAGGTNWVSYDEKYVDSDLSFVHSFDGQLVQPDGGNYTFVDPRTPRFGSPTENNISGGAYTRAPLISSQPTNWATTWLDYSGKLLSVVTEKPDTSSGFGSNFRGFSFPDWGSYAAAGLHIQAINTTGGVNAIFWQTGLFAQNDPSFPSDGLRFVGDIAGGVGVRDANYWSSPDGVVRRAMGGYVKSGSTSGQPLATATTFAGGTVAKAQSQSRPIVLNRPFRSVGELGYVFSGNPWMNIDFSTPESAYSELLDVFCATDNSPGDGLVAGKVDLNTRQPAVLASVLAGAYTDEVSSLQPQSPAVAPPSYSTAPLAAQDAQSIANLLVKRTTSAPPSSSINTSNGAQPLQNLGDVVGRWNGKQPLLSIGNPSPTSPHNIDGSKSYDGFSADLTSAGTMPLTSLSIDTLKIPRLRESAVRALASVGNTRVWNLMIDVIAQSGRYTPTATTPGNFAVEGEQRYWVHVAIDRYTGAILDTKLEVVKE